MNEFNGNSTSKVSALKTYINGNDLANLKILLRQRGDWPQDTDFLSYPIKKNFSLIILHLVLFSRVNLKANNGLAREVARGASDPNLGLLLDRAEAEPLFQIDLKLPFPLSANPKQDLIRIPVYRNSTKDILPRFDFPNPVLFVGTCPLDLDKWDSLIDLFLPFVTEKEDGVWAWPEVFFVQVALDLTREQDSNKLFFPQIEPQGREVSLLELHQSGLPIRSEQYKFLIERMRDHPSYSADQSWIISLLLDPLPLSVTLAPFLLSAPEMRDILNKIFSSRRVTDKQVNLALVMSEQERGRLLELGKIAIDFNRSENLEYLFRFSRCRLEGSSKFEGLLSYAIDQLAYQCVAVILDNDQITPDELSRALEQAQGLDDEVLVSVLTRKLETLLSATFNVLSTREGESDSSSGETDLSTEKFQTNKSLTRNALVRIVAIVDQLQENEQTIRLLDLISARTFAMFEKITSALPSQTRTCYLDMNKHFMGNLNSLLSDDEPSEVEITRDSDPTPEPVELTPDRDTLRPT